MKQLFTDSQKANFLMRFEHNQYSKAVGLIDKYADDWKLNGFQLIEFFSSNLLLICRSENYGVAVLKISLNTHFETEYKALLAFHGHRFCRLHEYSLKDGVCLLEYIEPGDTLFCGTSREERVCCFSELYNGLHIVAGSTTEFPTYLNWLEQGERIICRRDDCNNFIPFINKAKEIIFSVSTKYNRMLLLHGDLHHENILKNGAGGYTAIDPKGVIGDPVFDLSRFILDEFHDDLTSEPTESILNFIKLLSEHVYIPTNILLNCLYTEAVIWLCREGFANGEDLKNCDWLIQNMMLAYKMIL